MFEICQVPSGSMLIARAQDDLASIETPDGEVVSCSDYCSATQYALSCHAAASSDSIPTIPSPAPSLNCTVIPIPTPSTSLFYCCPCGQSVPGCERAEGDLAIPCPNSCSRATTRSQGAAAILRTTYGKATGSLGSSGEGSMCRVKPLTRRAAAASASSWSCAARGGTGHSRSGRPPAWVALAGCPSRDRRKPRSFGFSHRHDRDQVHPKLLLAP